MQTMFAKTGMVASEGSLFGKHHLTSISQSFVSWDVSQLALPSNNTHEGSLPYWVQLVI